MSKRSRDRNDYRKGLGKFVKITGLTRETLARIPGNMLYRDVNFSISTFDEMEESK
jgi:hypothetical protein